MFWLPLMWPRAGLIFQACASVYNFDMPNVPENYVHRIGRTAQAGPRT